MDRDEVKNTLPKLVSKFEKNVGTFSNYQCELGQFAESIPFNKKPAQQLLNGLACVHSADEKLSRTSDGKPLKENVKNSVVISAFNEKTDSKLTLTAARIEELLDSAKIYLNSSIFPKTKYLSYINNSSIKEQDQSKDQSKDDSFFSEYYQNLATQVCHVQKIDVLVEHVKNEFGKAVAAPRAGTRNKGDAAVLLISTPALNFNVQNKGVAHHLSDSDVSKYVKGMFENIFTAASLEGYHYITMPAAGLGQFEGEPEVYFNILADVADKYPTLNIIYHPAQYGNKFDEIMKKRNPKNIIRATVDVFYLADELTRNGYPCAFHNPSDADVVYGVYDVGEYWKNGTRYCYLGEEHACSMSTGPLNSKLLNPAVYANPIELNLDAEISHRIIKTTSAVNTAGTDSSSSFWRSGDSPNPDNANADEKTLLVDDNPKSSKTFCGCVVS